MRPDGGGTRVALSLMRALSGGGGAGGSTPAGPGRSADSVDQAGEGDIRSREDGSPGQGTLEVGEVRAPPGKAGACAGGDDGQDSTAHSTGLYGTPGAPHAGESDG
jgi:hypothetical protein